MRNCWNQIWKLWTLGAQIYAKDMLLDILAHFPVAMLVYWVTANCHGGHL